MSEATRARLLVFRVGTLVCAAEVDQVREILPRLPTTRIPGAPPVVAGLVNVRGKLVTVVDGWRALKQEAPQGAAGEGSTLVLSLGPGGGPAPAGEQEGGDGNDRLIGFTVDEVIDMLSVDDSALDDRSAGGLAGIDPTLVRAVGRRQGVGGGEGRGGVFVVLDVAALLGPILHEGREQ
jgi:chemotaxis signal transduction protein